MEICPKCKKYSLSMELRDGVARCFNVNCDFKGKIDSFRDYFEKFKISGLNWANYCAQTPVNLRVSGPSKQKSILRFFKGLILSLVSILRQTTSEV